MMSQQSKVDYSIVFFWMTLSISIIETMSQCEVIGFTLNNIQIKIVPHNWKFMEMGEGHIILQNTNHNDVLFDQVLSVCRHHIGTIPCELENIYTKVLNANQNIEPFLLKRQEVVLQSGESMKFIALMKNIIDVPIQECRVFLAQNLARSKEKWDYYLEFKPKTILPDIYSQQFIQEFSTKHQLNYLDLISLLTNSPLVEKTRWFKKNALKEVKKNANPFQTFAFKTNKIPNYLKKVKPTNNKVSQNTPQPTPSLQKISNETIYEIIKKTNLLPSILKMQLLFTEAHDFSESNVYNLWKHELNKESICEVVYNQIISELQASEPIENSLESLFGQAPTLNSTTKGQRSQIEKIIRFLISWTWKDVSLILRFKVDPSGEKIADYDLKIIDYELKQSSKLAQTIKKDEIFLKYYLTFKKLL